MTTSNSVTFTVVKHLPFGLLVQLEDGRSGVIRVRETSWSAEERQNWQQMFPAGWQSRAVILKMGDDGHLELSLRLARNDPWEQVPGRYRKGQVIQGVVTGLTNYGVFVQLTEGVTGLLHASQLPDWVQPNPLELFWPGDHVRVKIEQIDLAHRRISLGLATSALPIEPQPVQPRPTRPATTPLAGRSSPRITLDQFLRSGFPRQFILIVEDDPIQSTAVATWLSKVGQRVVVAANGAEALAWLDRECPDIALVDLGLPDTLGSDLARQIRQRWPQVKCTLATDWARADEHTRDLETLSAAGVGLLLKPLLPDDLLDLLQNRTLPASVLTGEPIQPALRQFDLPSPGRQAMQAALLALLDRCRSQTSFEAAFLFAVDTAQRTVEIVQRSGGGAINKDALPSVIYSPVRDAAEDGEVVAVERLTEQDARRFRYLLDFYGLAACLGVPVPAGAPVKHALMLLDSRTRAIPSEAVAFTQSAALALGALLDRQAFQEQAILVQRTALLGHLTRGLVHEINHQLNPLIFSADSLEKSLEDISARAASPESVRQKAQEASGYLADVQKAALSLTSTTRQFGRILTRNRPQLLRVDELILETAYLLKDASRQAKVSIELAATNALVLVRSEGSAIEQVLLNVLLNAVQQIGECRPTSGGWVQVRIETFTPPSGQIMCRISVEDNGPGIHLRLWEQIFEIGYSTRKEGSGMGLYISRSLMEAAGGKIYVADSHILSGTTFALELPCQV